MATFTTGKGRFALSATNASMLEPQYDSIIDYDDPEDLSAFMMMKANSKEIDDIEFNCFAGELNPRIGTLNNGTVAIATDATSFIVTSTAGVRVDDILHIATAAQDGEHVRVTSIGTNAFTVARINTTPLTINTSAKYVIVGAASSTIATAGITATFMEPAVVTSRLQLIRRAFSLSETEDKTAVRVQTRNQQKGEQTRKDFRLDLAHTFWFSISTADTTNTYQTTKGINEQLASNGASLLIDEGGALTMVTLSALMEGLAPYGRSKTYDCFVGSLALGGLAELAQTANVGALDVNSKVYGAAAQSIVVGDFVFKFRYERLFDIIGAPYSGYIFALDLKELELFHMRGRKFITQAGTKTTPLSEVVDTQYKAHVGLGVTWPKRHGLIYGVT